MKNNLILLVLSLLILNTTSAQSDDKLNQIFSEIDEISDSNSIDNPLWRGQHPEKYIFQTIDSQIEIVDKYRKKLEELKSIPDAELSDQSRINKQIKILQLENVISEIDYKLYLIPFDSEGGFFNSPSFFLSNLPFNTVEDYEKYLTWLPTFTQSLNYNKDLMKIGIKEKIQAPKVIVNNIISLLDPWTQSDVSLHPFYKPINNIPKTISEPDRKAIQEKAVAIIENNILPSYVELKKFISTKYLKSAPEKIGIREIKNGAAYYENRVRYFTTLDITPDSVYATGEAEVKRIRQQMEQIIEDLEFEGSFAEFLQFLRTDPQFYAKSGQELLNYAA